MKQVVVKGSLSYDYIMDFPGRFADRIMPDKIHVLSLSFLVEKLTKQIGGCAINIAYTLKLLGIEPFLLAYAGKDFSEMKEFLLKNNIATDGIRIFDDEYCSSYHVITDHEDNQIGAFYNGASKHNKELSLKGETLLGKVSPFENFVTIGPTDPAAMVKYVNECRQLSLRYLYDPSFQIADFSPLELRTGIEGCAILIGNDYEIALSEKKLGKTHEGLVATATATVPVLVTTLGPKGSVIETKKEAIHIKPAKPKNSSDPTGAGDAYRAGFLAGYLRGFDLVTCGQMGSVAAVYTVEKYGTVTHHFTIKEFEKRYFENYGTRITL